MNLKRRLEGLEERIGTDRESLEDAVGREVIRRMSTEELREYRDALKRLIEGGEPAEEDAPIWHRRAQLYEEVSREFAGAQAREA
jgi:hypothetical protein